MQMELELEKQEIPFVHVTSLSRELRVRKGFLVFQCHETQQQTQQKILLFSGHYKWTYFKENPFSIVVVLCFVAR
jgi:hypothetical protein